MFQALLKHTGQIFRRTRESLRGRSRMVVPAPVVENAATLSSLTRVLVTDTVRQTLFEEYAQHRAGPRGEEETGWVLLGHRQNDEALVLATLPAGMQRDAGIAHVRFNSDAQIVGSRIVRDLDRKLTILGLVHTHPGSLRHPSDGDYQGDRIWVGQLRGQEGIFGIGTADYGPANGEGIASSMGHVQCLGKLRLSWYALGEGDRGYRPLPVVSTPGPDLARSLHPIWPIIEEHAKVIERLCRQLAGIRFRVNAGPGNAVLSVRVPLAAGGDAVEVAFSGGAVQYFLLRPGEILTVDSAEERVDRVVYLLLAELATWHS